MALLDIFKVVAPVVIPGAGGVLTAEALTLAKNVKFGGPANPSGGNNQNNATRDKGDSARIASANVQAQSRKTTEALDKSTAVRFT
jgi:hypothetical protein